ncbi:MAG: response regulator [Planctomycetes bacterium]|nr:response regulator [Planctomycetota bacterium]
MNPMTILVVEDNPITRKMVRITLQAEGYRMLEAEDGQTALDQASKSVPDLILQDLMLPDMDGFDLAHKLRAIPGVDAIPLIAFSGFLSRLEQARSAQVDFTDVLFKPVEPSRLLEMIRTYLRQPEPTTEKVGQDRRILLVDDDPFQLRLLKLQLEQAGFKIVTARDGEEALTRARGAPPDAIVSDVLMPRLDGFRLCQAIRRDSRLAHLPVLLLSSAYIEEADLELARKAGANEMLIRQPDGQESMKKLLGFLSRESRPPPTSGSEISTEAYMFRVVRQLERQILRNRNLSRRLAILEAEVAILTGVSDSLKSRPNVDQLLKLVLERCLDSAGASRGVIYLRGPKGSLVPSAVFGFARDADLADFFGHAGLLNRIIDSKQVVELSPSGGFSESRGLLERADATSFMIAPIRFGEESLGALVVATEWKELGKEWLSFAAALGNQIGQAIGLIRAMLAVAVSERRYRSLMEQANDAVFILSMQGTILEMNHRAQEMLGYSREELVGKSYKTAISPGSLERNVTLFEKMLQEGSLLTEGLDLVRKDGRIVYTDFSASVVDLEEPVVLAIAHDVTSRKRGEQRFTAQYAVTRILAECSTFEETAPKILRTLCESFGWHVGSFWILDDAEGVLRCLDMWHSPAIADSQFLERRRRVTFTSGVGLPGRIWKDRRPAWNTDISVDPSLAVPSGLHAGVAVPILLGSRFFGVLEFFHRELQPPDEDLLRMMASMGNQIGQFIEKRRTEESLRHSEEQLRQAQKIEAIGRLAGGVAHDFNNLLTAILGYAELAKARLDEQNPLFHDIDEIQKAGQRAASLTHQLLAFGRKQVLQPRILDLNDLVVNIEKMLRRVIGEDINLITRLHAGLGRVKADPGQIEQILLNLAVNSRDAMPHGGKLVIETTNAELDERYAETHKDVTPGRYVMLSVTDTGTGMAPHIKAHLFEPFFTTKEQGRGTGLGLSTVYGIVTQSGGHISMYSELGHGTAFKVYLPQVEETADSPTPVLRRTGPPRGTETILLVEDEDAVRSLAATVLRKNGYTVLEARHGEEGVKLCSAHDTPIHLIITDVIMPQMGGRELVQRLGAARSSVRVLYMSGYSEYAINLKAMAPDTPFLQKPFLPDTLLRKVREVLDAPTRGIERPKTS